MQPPRAARARPGPPSTHKSSSSRPRIAASPTSDSKICRTLTWDRLVLGRPEHQLEDTTRGKLAKEILFGITHFVRKVHVIVPRGTDTLFYPIHSDPPYSFPFHSHSKYDQDNERAMSGAGARCYDEDVQMESTAAPSSSNTRRSPAATTMQAEQAQSHSEPMVKSTYTNLVPKQLIGSGSFGKYKIYFLHSLSERRYLEPHRSPGGTKERSTGHALTCSDSIALDKCHQYLGTEQDNF